ncbi:hypothetical protein GCM10022225_43740 [Plantactinospora mayteni]|uniref:Knr4/Smi1-like domain-containing protein n=1 Tax=Plantactinospora mayteni TaxID=566021 RepID=A0ABQ4ERY6_9ACTN|nr:DUF4241 domain-containing protein [Plantactinospora mayteni]GIG97416.1 hypothetical protein Pma05_39890 [Plantactinospora mayteni]
MISKDYSIVFQDNQVLTCGESLHHVLHCRQIGSLSLPSGELVARDPFTDPGLGFDRLVPPGNYPVFAISTYSDLAHEIAFAAIRLTQTEPIRWEPAHGTDEQGRAYGYGVDSATGSFMDRATGDLLDELLAEDYDQMYNRHDGRPWAEFVIPRKRDAKIFLFFLGADGGYPSYYGYDTHGTIACIVTDFFGLRREEVSAWPSMLPSIPTGFSAQFYAWLGEINGLLQFPGEWDQRQAVPQEDLHYLEQSQGISLPEDLRLHYQNAGFWLHGPEPLQEWWPQLETRARTALETDKPMLPILRSWNSIAVCDHNNYVIYEPYPEWESPGGNFEYPDLKTYLLNTIMRDLGSLSQSN